MNDIRTEQFIEIIEELKLDKKSIAQEYAYHIVERNDLDWARINAAIINRWSTFALNRIKKDAWRLVG